MRIRAARRRGRRERRRRVGLRRSRTSDPKRHRHLWWARRRWSTTPASVRDRMLGRHDHRESGTPSSGCTYGDVTPTPHMPSSIGATGPRPVRAMTPGSSTPPSPSGIYGNVGQTNYGAAKAGIASFTVIAAMELARYGVTVNAIAPAALTRMTENLGMGSSSSAKKPEEFEPSIRETSPPSWSGSGARKQPKSPAGCSTSKGAPSRSPKAGSPDPEPTKRIVGTPPNSVRSSPDSSRPPPPTPTWAGDK